MPRPVDECQTGFWKSAAFIDVFINEYTDQQIAWDPNIYPGPLGNFTCTMVRGEYLVKKDCLDSEPCGICRIEAQKRLKLKGDLDIY